MAFDGFFCAALARELDRTISGCRVEKVNFRASSAELSLYGDKTKKYLLLSLSAAANFITVTKEPSLANDAPNAFCLLLRKHFQSAKLRAVKAVEDERIIEFVFDSPDELGHISEKTLYAEIMGRYSNLVVTSGGRVLGSLFAGDLVSYKRALMPGLMYELPPKQEKITSRGITYEDFAGKCALYGGKTCDRFLLDTFFCFSPLSAHETAAEAGCKDGECVENCDVRALYGAVKRLHERVENCDFTPTAVYDGENGVEFYFTDITRYGNVEKRVFGSLCELTHAFFAQKGAKNLLRERTSDLNSVVNQRIKRIEKKELAQREELEECAQKDKYRVMGELITSNIFKIKQGDAECVCTDWATGEEIKVELDDRLSPSANAAKLFKKYRKLKNAELVIAEQLAAAEAEKTYLESVLDAIDRCESGDDAEHIKEELVQGGYIRKGSKKVFLKPARPVEYVTSGGFRVRAGRNNIMNDALTKSAAKDDLWFHVKKFSGSHVILYTEGREPGDGDYTEAAEIAARHSSVRNGENVQVDYTRVRNVRKPAGGKPGYVTYDKYYTAVVDPSRAPVPEGKKSK